MRTLALLLAAMPAYAAVSGVVTNQTTGKPQAGATVGLYKVGTQTGLELIDQAKTDANGAFTIAREIQGPHLIRTAFDGVTYNHMLPPGQPTTGLALDVFNAAKQPGEARVGKHMIVLEPSGGQLGITESYLFSNPGKTAWYDPDAGTIKVWIPEGAAKPNVRATAPNGAPIGAPITKTAKADTWAIDFPIKPGDTRVDVDYTVPYTEGANFAGKVLTKDENTYLIVPNGVALKGDGLNDLGIHQQTQTHIYGLTKPSYDIQLTGSLAPAPSGPDAQAESEGPKIEQVMPRVYGNRYLILGSALGILALGFALLYRMSPGAR